MRRRLTRLFALIRKEMVQLLRDRRTLGLILSIPLIELFLFAYAVDLTVDHIPLAVANMSHDRASQELIDALVVSGYFDVAQYVADEAAVAGALDAGDVRAGLVIPPAFGSAVERGEAQALLLLDGSDSFTVQSGYGAAVAVGQMHALRVARRQLDRAGVTMVEAPIDVRTRVLFNPEMDDLVFIVPGMAALLLQVMAINLTALGVVREREMGTLEGLLATPARPLELMVGKLIPNMLVSGLALLAVMVASVAWFGVPFRGDPWLFALLALLFLISGLGLGLLVSSVARTQKEAQQLSMLLLLLSLLLTGFIYPRAPMPAPVQFIGNLIPLTYFIRITRGIITRGVGLAFFWSDVVALIIYGLVVMLLAAATFRKRLD